MKLFAHLRPAIGGGRSVGSVGRSVKKGGYKFTLGALRALRSDVFHVFSPQGVPHTKLEVRAREREPESVSELKCHF